MNFDESKQKMLISLQTNDHQFNSELIVILCCVLCFCTPEEEPLLKGPA